MFVEVGRDDGVFFGTPFLSKNQWWFVEIYTKLAVSYELLPALYLR